MNIISKTLILGVLTFLGSTSPILAAPNILYIPLDNRPVCLDYVQDTAKAAGYDLTVPPANLISDHRSYGDNEALWKWLEKAAPKAKAAVISTDSLTYGGLVASRRHKHTERYLKRKVDRLSALKTAYPGLKLYGFSTIMRTPRESIGNVEPDYYQYFGPKIFRLTQLADKEDTGILTGKEAAERAKLLAYIPSDILHDWNIRRTVNYKTNTRLVTLCHDKVFHYLAVGKDDDAPLSQTHMEARHLEHFSSGITQNRFQIIPGVDQLGLLLVTRAINEMRGDNPKVYVSYAPGKGGQTIPLYSDETIHTSAEKQILASGGRRIADPKKASLILAINTPEDGVCQDSTSNENAPYASPANKKYVKELSSLTKRYPVALADVSYANGADNGFMYELENRKLLGNFVAYSGWNTADNSIGFALAQGELSKKMSNQDLEKLLKVRYLDDWIYQANIRYRVALAIEKHDFKLKYDLGKYYNRVLSATNTLFKKYVQDEPYLRGTEYTVEFPWNRLFEVDVKIEN